MKRELIPISTPFIKLDSLLKFCGAAQTGGHAKEMITNGNIKVNGAVCTQRGKKIIPGNIVLLEEEEMEYEVVSNAD